MVNGMKRQKLLHPIEMKMIILVHLLQLVVVMLSLEPLKMMIREIIQVQHIFSNMQILILILIIYLQIVMSVLEQMLQLLHYLLLDQKVTLRAVM